MQTFLPYECFVESASVLDMRRLGKQRVEALQILKCLCEGGGWKNHPAVRMWENYEQALVQYGEAICMEWRLQGYKDTCLEKIQVYKNGEVIMPPWLGDEEFHLSHQSNLVRKFPEHYRPFWPNVPDDLPYIWPHKDLVNDTKKIYL